MIGRSITWTALLGVTLVALGCQGRGESLFKGSPKVTHYRNVATEIEYPDVKTGIRQEAISTAPPRRISDSEHIAFRDLTLEQCIQTALTNNSTLQGLGARVLTAPASVSTIYEPAIRESDPRFGTEAALSAFDAQLSTSLFWEKNARVINNENFRDGFIQDRSFFQTEISKIAATGTQFAVRNITEYEASNEPGNVFGSAWDTMFETEFRHPLLQGGGIQFNRIAGPNSTPGFFFSNGVLIARINTDISLADFELGLRTLVSDVENAYWDLYFAYRDLDAKRTGRDSALQTWRSVYALFQSRRAGGEAAKEAQAREQYYLFEAQVQDALSGAPSRGTFNNQGSTGGSFQGTGGVYTAERRLRKIMGLPATEERLIRPSDSPPRAEIVFEWEKILPEALVRRVEIRRQKWLVKRKQLELIASRNFLLPRFDVVGLYRWRGYGDDLINTNNRQFRKFDNAFQNLTNGEFQEWQLGFTFDMPFGFRQGHAAVRNAELQLAREKAMLREQELEVSHGLSAAVSDLDRAYTLVQTNLNRRIAAKRQLDAVEVEYRLEQASLDILLDAQRRLAEADVAYYRSLVEYALAVKNVHLEKGTLLDYNNIRLSEGAWPCQAYKDARELARHFRKRHIDYGWVQPATVSEGTYDQDPLQEGPGQAPARETLPGIPEQELPPKPETQPQPETQPMPQPQNTPAPAPQLNPPQRPSGDQRPRRLPSPQPPADAPDNPNTTFNQQPQPPLQSQPLAPIPQLPGGQQPPLPAASTPVKKTRPQPPRKFSPPLAEPPLPAASTTRARKPGPAAEENLQAPPLPEGSSASEPAQSAQVEAPAPQAAPQLPPARGQQEHEADLQEAPLPPVHLSGPLPRKSTGPPRQSAPRTSPREESRDLPEAPAPDALPMPNGQTWKSTRQPTDQKQATAASPRPAKSATRADRDGKDLAMPPEPAPAPAPLTQTDRDVRPEPTRQAQPRQRRRVVRASNVEPQEAPLPPATEQHAGRDTTVNRPRQTAPQSLQLPQPTAPKRTRDESLQDAPEPPSPATVTQRGTRNAGRSEYQQKTAKKTSAPQPAPMPEPMDAPETPQQVRLAYPTQRGRAAQPATPNKPLSNTNTKQSAVRSEPESAPLPPSEAPLAQAPAPEAAEESAPQADPEVVPATLVAPEPAGDLKVPQPKRKKSTQPAGPRFIEQPNFGEHFGTEEEPPAQDSQWKSSPRREAPQPASVNQPPLQPPARQQKAAPRSRRPVSRPAETVIEDRHQAPQPSPLPPPSKRAQAPARPPVSPEAKASTTDRLPPATRPAPAANRPSEPSGYAEAVSQDKKPSLLPGPQILRRRPEPQRSPRPRPAPQRPTPPQEEAGFASVSAAGTASVEDAGTAEAADAGFVTVSDDQSDEKK